MSVFSALQSLVSPQERARSASTSHIRVPDGDLVPYTHRGRWSAFLHDDTLSEQEFLSAYRGLVSMLLDFRARQIAPLLLQASVMRRVEGEQDEWEPVNPDDATGRWAQLWSRPCDYMAPHSFFRWAVMNYDATGHADFVVEHDSEPGLGELPSAFLPVYRSWGKLVPQFDRRGAKTGWEYWGTDGRRDQLRTEDVVRIDRMHPVSPYKTAGLVEAAAYEIDTDLAAATYARDSMASQGIPDVVLEYPDDSQIGKDEAQEFARQFAQDYGAIRDRVPAIKGAEIKSMRLSESDQQFQEQREFLRELLYELFSVHRGLFAENATEANAKSAIETFERFTVQSEVDAHCATWTFELERVFQAEPNVLRIEPPDAITVDPVEQAELDQKHLEQGRVSPNDLNRRDGMGEVPGGDTYYRSGMLVPVTDDDPTNEA